MRLARNLGLALAVSGCAPHATAVDQALVLAAQRDDVRAIATLRSELARSPGDVPARRLLVRVLAASGDLPGAQAEVEAWIRSTRPDDPAPYIERGHAEELVHDFEAALSSYDEAADRAPLVPDGPREGGLRAARWGEVDVARPRLEEAVRRGDRSSDLYHALGLVRLQQGDLDGAEAAYHEGLRFHPEAAECWLGLASAAVARPDPAKALTAYDGLLRVRPGFAPGQLGRAWALARLNRPKEAEAALAEALRLGEPADRVRGTRSRLGL